MIYLYLVNISIVYMALKNVVILTGAGISAESGLKTFRDADGLWENYRIEDVATPEAWRRDPHLVQQFYNERRKSVLEAEPNEAHKALVRLQDKYNVHIITQNIDDLHERAGSAKVLHLHGVITRSQSDVDPTLTYPIQGWELKFTDRCIHGKPLRPHVVWFGEEVPNMEIAAAICETADIFMVIGTSLQVYPAAGLTQFVPGIAVKYIVDPYADDIGGANSFHKINEAATVGVPALIAGLL
jgi:NAD-dependent deacetylase